ncbi:hypothetical protein D3C77_653630 [compost metagenome]
MVSARPAIVAAWASLSRLNPASNWSMVWRYSRTSARSILRSAVWPKGSNQVPRRPFMRVSNFSAVMVRGPSVILRGTPVRGSLRAKIGGAI